MYAIKVPVFMLACVMDIEKSDIHFNYVTNTLVHTTSGCHSEPVRTTEPPCLLRNCISTCHFATMELHRLYHRFSHPSADKLDSFFSRTKLDVASRRPHIILHKVECKCCVCKIYAQAPQCFKFKPAGKLRLPITAALLTFISTVKQRATFWRMPHIAKRPISFPPV